MERALIELLLAQASVAALVSDRIFWSERDRDRRDLPAVVCHLIDDQQLGHMKGQSTESSAHVQIDCLGATSGEAVKLGNTLRAAIAGQSGGGFESVFADFRLDDTTPAANGDPTIHRRIIEARCVFDRA